jgi:hypothetical protein
MVLDVVVVVDLRGAVKDHVYDHVKDQVHGNQSSSLER